MKLDSIHYAGSHGLDIVGPRDAAGQGKQHQPVPWAKELMSAIHPQLAASVAPIAGSSVENNAYCLSVHFRLCPDREADVAAAVERIVAPHPNLRVCRGRKVYEVRPVVEWNKGRALMYMVDQICHQVRGGRAAQGGPGRRRCAPPTSGARSACVGGQSSGRVCSEPRMKRHCPISLTSRPSLAGGGCSGGRHRCRRSRGRGAASADGLAVRCVFWRRHV